MSTGRDGMNDERYAELRCILEERSEEMASEVKDKIRLAEPKADRRRRAGLPTSPRTRKRTFKMTSSSRSSR